ncbi:putative lyase [compost metagenome]
MIPTKITSFSTPEIFRRLLNNKSKTNYWRYIMELRKRKSAEIYNRAIELTKSSDKKEKIIGINILAQFGNPRIHKNQTLKIYFNLLKEEDDIYVVSSILYAIGHNNEKLTENQIEFICHYDSSKSSTVRHSLTFAVSGIENKNAIHTMIKLSKDRDPEVRDWATFAIAALISNDNDAIREALWERVMDSDKKIQNEAIFGLATRKDARIKEVLKKELETVDFNSSYTLEAIEVFNDKEFITLLEDKIIKNKIEQVIPEDWLISTLDHLRK